MKSIFIALLIIFTAPAYGRVTSDTCERYNEDQENCTKKLGCVFISGGMSTSCQACDSSTYYDKETKTCKDCPDDAEAINETGAVGIDECEKDCKQQSYDDIEFIGTPNPIKQFVNRNESCKYHYTNLRCNILKYYTLPYDSMINSQSTISSGAFDTYKTQYCRDTLDCKDIFSTNFPPQMRILYNNVKQQAYSIDMTEIIKRPDTTCASQLYGTARYVYKQNTQKWDVSECKIKDEMEGDRCHLYNDKGDQIGIVWISVNADQPDNTIMIANIYQGTSNPSRCENELCTTTDNHVCVPLKNGYYKADAFMCGGACPMGTTTTASSGPIGITACHTTAATQFVDSNGNSFSIEDLFGSDITLNAVQ